MRRADFISFHFICVRCGIFHAQNVAMHCNNSNRSKVRKQRNGKWIRVKFNVSYLLSVCVCVCVNYGYFSVRSSIRERFVSVCNSNHIDAERRALSFQKKTQRKNEGKESKRFYDATERNQLVHGKRHVQSYHDQFSYFFSRRLLNLSVPTNNTLLFN